MLDAAADVTLTSELRPREEAAAADDPRRGEGFAGGALDPVAAEAGPRTRGPAAGHALDPARARLRHGQRLRRRAAVTTTVDGDAARASSPSAPSCDPAGSCGCDKLLAYHWAEVRGARPWPPACTTRSTAPARTGTTAWRARTRTGRGVLAARSDVEVQGAPDVQLAVRFNLFQLLQATAGTDGLGVPAKGVTGRGYEGHYFWDTEIYVVPVLVHLMPERARALLEVRCAMLPAARDGAQELGHRGALFPWRTINGTDASAWYAAGTAQYHINADVAYALHLYGRVTGDLAFLLTRAPRRWSRRRASGCRSGSSPPARRRVPCTP